MNSKSTKPFDCRGDFRESLTGTTPDPRFSGIVHPKQVETHLVQSHPVRSVAVVVRLLLLGVIIVAGGNRNSLVGDAGVRAHFPLTRAEMLDQSTLREKVLMDRTIESTLHPGTRLRHLRVSFFSHEWKDGPWRATLQVLIPEKLDAERDGVVVFAPLGSINIAQGVDIKRDIFERTAGELGIPMASIPRMGKHYGHDEIHDMSDHLMLMYLKTGDPSWMPIYPTAAVRARAATLIAKLTQRPVKRIIHMGSSISANQAWLWPLHDTRVAALVATGDIGFYRDWFPADGTIKSTRQAHVAMSKASAALQDQAIALGDPYAYGKEFKVRLLQIAGSNDFACPLLSVPKFLAALAGPTHLAIVPNYGHGCASARHPELLRMWIDHVLDARPLSRVNVKTFKISGTQLRVAATVSGKTPLKAVKLVYATTSEDKFLLSVTAADSPRNNYTKAKWQETPMKFENSQWCVSVDLEQARFIAAYVDVRDALDGREGYASSGIQWSAVE